MVQKCWSELFTLGLAQCAQSMALSTILTAIVNHLQISLQQGEYLLLFLWQEPILFLTPLNVVTKWSLLYFISNNVCQMLMWNVDQHRLVRSTMVTQPSTTGMVWQESNTLKFSSVIDFLPPKWVLSSWEPSVSCIMQIKRCHHLL